MLINLQGTYGRGTNGIVALDAPILSVGQTKQSTTTLSWTSVDNATGYTWQIDTSAVFNAPTQASGNVLTIDYNLLIPNQRYYFRVKATNETQNSAWASANFIITALIDISVSSLIATPASTQVVLNWTNPASGFTAIVVDYKLASSGTWVNFSNTGTPTSATITGLTNSELYDFRVTPTASVDYNGVTSTIQSTPASVPQLNAPTGMSFTDNGGGSVAVNVTYSGEAGVTYVIYRNGEARYSGTTVPTNITGFVDGTTYTMECEVAKTGFITSSRYSIAYAHNVVVLENTIEFYGGVGDGQYYFGNVNYTPDVENSRTFVTLTGGATWPDVCEDLKIVTNRIHQFDTVYPPSTENYIPTFIGCRYATILTRISDTEIIIDKVINGGSYTTPTSVTEKDCYIFTNNLSAFKTAAEAIGGEADILLQDDHAYVLFGLPNFAHNRNITFKRDGLGVNKPIIHISVEDGFNSVLYSTGAVAPSFTAQYNSRYFVNCNSNNYDITFEDVDICPPIYSAAYVQYGHPDLIMFDDKSTLSSTLTATRKIKNSDWSRIKTLMIAALGSQRTGATWLLPMLNEQTHGGGTIVGDDVDQMLTYELEDTEWRALMIHNLKNDGKAGTLFKCHNTTTKELREVIEAKAISYSNVQTTYANSANGLHTIVTLHDGTGSFYFLSNQDWNGGTSANYQTYNRCQTGSNKVLYFSNNADFIELHGGNTDYCLYVNPIITNGYTAKLFDRLPQVGDLITKWISGYDVAAIEGVKTGKTGVLKKVSDTVWWFWGYAINVGDVLRDTETDVTATVTVSNYQQLNAIPTGAHKTIHYYVVTLNTAITSTIEDVEFEVISSTTEALIGAPKANTRHYIDRDHVNHLFYTDAGCNMYLKNVNCYGYWRGEGGLGGTPAHMYLATKIAYFENVGMYGNGDPVYNNGTQGHIGNAWNVDYMKYRESIQGSDYQIKIIGGYVNLTQFNYGNATVNISGQPTFKTLFAYNPIISGGIVMDGTSSTCSIRLTDCNLDLSNSVLQGNVYINGTCELTMNNVSGMEHTIPGRLLDFAINAGTTPDITITGDDFDLPLDLTGAAFTEGNTNIVVTNKTRTKGHYSNKTFKIPFTPTVYPDVDLTVKDTLGTDILYDT